MYRDSFVKYGRTVVNWKLLNFNKDLLSPLVVPELPALHSPDFKVLLSNYEATKWKFLAVRNKTELTLYLKRSDDSTRRQSMADYYITYDVQIRDQVNEKCLKRKQGKMIFHSSFFFDEEKLGKIVNFRECDKPRSYRIIYNDSIQIVVYLEVIRKEIDLSFALNKTLTSHYEKIFNNKEYSDFLITSPDGNEIYVHRNILCMRSPVFDAMINSSMIEENEKKVLICDIEGRVLTELVRFIYSGKVNEIDSIASELLYAANKYDVSDLKPLCAESLALNVTVDNVLDTIILADLHQELPLRKFCMDFIKFKYMDLKDSETWKNFSAELLKEILDYVMASRNEKKDECTIITNIKRTGNQATVGN